MVSTYVAFPPLGVVLVMVLGVGVAEHSGLVGAGLKQLLDLTPRRLLTPMLALVSIASHTIADAAMVALVPLGGALFYAAGRHPLADP
jgi:p-aminobenzoyl-glutamate transporter AbgT